LVTLYVSTIICERLERLKTTNEGKVEGQLQSQRQSNRRPHVVNRYESKTKYTRSVAVEHKGSKGGGAVSRHHEEHVLWSKSLRRSRLGNVQKWMKQFLLLPMNEEDRIDNRVASNLRLANMKRAARLCNR
jgi:hypothetical protein